MGGWHKSAALVCGASAQNQATTNRQNCHNIAMFIFHSIWMRMGAVYLCGEQESKGEGPHSCEV